MFRHILQKVEISPPGKTQQQKIVAHRQGEQLATTRNPLFFKILVSFNLYIALAETQQLLQNISDVDRY